MRQIANTEAELSKYDEEHSNKDGRVFNYVVNNKRAKAKLLKGAKRGKHLVVESKNGCVNLIFSDGSYLETVLPLLKSWHQKVNEKILLNNTEIEVVEFDVGIEDSQKHIDTKLVIVSNNCRLVLHAYNSTQKIMIQGQNYENFAMNCLEPFFKDKIEETIEQITKLNDDIKDSLEMKHKKIEKTFNCPQCGFVCISNGELKVHMKSCHSKPALCSPPRNKAPKILQEDISISELNEKEILAVENCAPQAQKCIWNSCAYISKDEEDLKDHLEEKHEKLISETVKDNCINGKDEVLELARNDDEEEQSKEEELVSKNVSVDVVALFMCEECGFHTNNNDDLKVHQDNIHSQKQKQQVVDENIPDFEANKISEEAQEEKKLINSIKCHFCDSTFTCLTQLKDHIVNEHCSDKTDVIQQMKSETCTRCAECNFVGTPTELKSHNSKHDNHTFKCRICEQVFQDVESLNNHIRAKGFPNHTNSPEPFPCEICGLVMATFDLLKKHMTTFHSPSIEACRYCDHRAVSKDDLQEHLIENHEDIVILHTMASEVNSIHDKFNSLDSFKQEVMSLLAKLFSSHNEIKQELFLVRNNQAYDKPQPATNVEKPFEETKETPRKSYKEIVESNIKNIREESEKHQNRSEEKVEKVLWVGTSFSKSLDIHKFQSDTKTRVKNVKAFGIKKEENQFYPERNFTSIVPDAVKDEEPDTIVLEGGSIEISNIDVRAALMDQEKEIKDYEKEWFEKTERDSANLFEVAERALKQKPNSKVIIVKRLPRHDPFSVDPLGIKKKLSKFGNDAYDQLWFKRGGPKNIHIVDFGLGTENSPFLQKLIFGNPASNSYDGIHLRGQGASRHLTYRAVQAMKPVLKTNTLPGRFSLHGSHRSCPQTIFQQKQRNNQTQMFKTKEGSQKIAYSIPTQNSFEVLGNC